MVAPAAGEPLPSEAMQKLRLGNYLGTLEADPDDLAAVEGIREIIASRDPERLGEEPVRLLEMARQGHELRAEFGTVARLIEVELPLVEDDRAFAGSLYKELGRLRADFLLEPEAALEAYGKALEYRGEDSEIHDAQKRLEQAEASWKKFAKRLVEEAESATDLSLKTSLLLRAATFAWQWKRKGKTKDADKLWRRVLELDPANLKAALLYEHILREREEWRALAQHLLDTAEAVREKQDRINCYVRSARVFARKLGEKNRAAACYERVLDFDPTHAEAMAYLSEYFTESEQWDHLAGLYEDALRVPQKLEVEQGVLLQIGMVHYRMRKRPEDAEPHFARLRKLDPTHPAMLDFYRAYFATPAEAESMIRILSDAQRVCTDPARKLELASEAARLSQSAPGMGERAIEAWKVVQRLDAGNEEAARVLKDLYRKAEKWNALVDILKTQIDATPDESEEGKAQKVALLRELAEVYRDHLRLEGMLINAHNAILRIVPGDRTTLDALAHKYRELGRWNDLINVLTTEAELLPDVSARIRMYLQVAALWVERFSNYNQAASPLEKVLELDPQNREALSRLREIYEKKRAWKQLFEVTKKERSVASDPTARAKLTVAMAELAADRLQRYDEALVLWQEVLGDDHYGSVAAEAVEKLAEREKDWKTLAAVLDRQVAVETSDEAKIRVLLKLGSLHAERLDDPEGASRAWRRILAIDPRQGRALRSLRDSLLSFGEWDGLEQLYERAGDFEALVDVLSGEADRVEDPAVKIDLSFRVARIFEEKIKEPARAQRSYERVLAVDPKNARAARALAPIYEAEEKWSKLCAMLDIVLSSLAPDEKEERLLLLGRLRVLSQEKLRDGELAFRHALAGYELAPESAATRQALESAAEIAQAFERVVEAYAARLAKAEPAEALALHRRIAGLAGERLGRSELAAEHWRKVLASEPADTAALTALDRIYRAENRTQDIRGLLTHRLERETDSAVRWDILKELAILEELKLGDADGAAARYRALTELDPASGEAWAALDRLALAAERYDELAKVLEKRRELDTERSASVEFGSRLGLLCLEKLDDAERAVDVLAQVIEIEPGQGASLAALEQIAEQKKKLAPKVLSTLEKAYERIGRFDKLANVIGQRLKTVKDEAELRRLRLRLAEISGGKLGDSLGAYASLEAAFLEQPSDTTLWDRLAEAAELAKQHRALAGAYGLAIDAGDLSDADRVELAVRAARIYDEILGEPQQAEAFHRRVLAHDPLADVAFIALKEVYTNNERWDDLQALYKKRIEETVDAGQKLDLLLQVCFLFEEILDRPDSAIEAYEAVLELAPDHGPSRRTLEKLYERTERHRDLAELLRENLEQAEGYDQVDLMYRLGDLHETKLAEPGVAVDHYEGVLQQQPHHLRAQAALARLLSVPGQRQRVAAILEPIYESQGAYPDLVRVLEIQLADREGAEAKGALCMRIGELYEQRVKDAEGAFTAYANAVDADPADRAAREALARIAKSRDSYRRKRAQVLERAVSAVQDADLQVDLLSELGQLLDEYLDDKVAAERAYERLIEVAHGRDDVVLEASRALERLHLQSGDHVRLAKDLERQAELELDVRARERLYVRLSELYEHKLDNAEAAIVARQKCLDLDDRNADALIALEGLFERAHRFPALVEILQRRVQIEDSEAERRALSRRIALTYEEKLGDSERAIEAYNEVRNNFGNDADTLASLARLYEAAASYPELLEVLESEAALAVTGEQRAALRFRIAEIQREKQKETEAAIGTYEIVLEDDGEHAGALAALDTIIHAPEGAYRKDAARVVTPRYEALGLYDKLLAVLDRLAEDDDELEKLEALRKAASVAERGQNDAASAMRYIGRALRVAHSHDSLSELLTEYGRLADLTSGFAEYVATLEEIAPQIFDIEQKVRVYRRVAEVAREKLSDTALARASYRRVLEEQADDVPALDALLLLDQEAGDHAALIDVLKRKITLVSAPTERAALLMRQAEVYERGADQPEHAIEALEEIIAETPLPAAYDGLERLYQRTLRWADLSALFEGQIARGVGDAVALRYKLAHNSRQHLSDTHAALEHLREAIAHNPRHADSIALLETIMGEQGEHRAIAAEILEPGYLARMEWAKLTAALRARVEAELDLDERKRLLVRLGRIYEEQLEDFDETLEIYARLFREDPRDEEVWETLTRLAKLGGQWSRLAKILQEAFADGPVEDPVIAKLARYVGSLYDERIANLVKAAESYEKALAFDREDREAFGALESAYLRSGNHAALVELYTVQAGVARDDAERVALLHKRAKIHADEQQDGARAVATYREILEIIPDDAAAIAGLEARLAATEDYTGLAEHLRRRIEHSVGTPDETTQKHRLAELLWERLQDETGAIDLFEEITQTDPKHGPAMLSLERIVQEERHRLRVTEILDPVYRHLDQWKKLIAIYEARLPLLTDRSEAVRLLAEIAELHENRGRDLRLAFQAYARAFAREPDNDGTRAHIDRLASRVGAWDDHVAAYEAALAAATEDSVKVQLLTTIARVHDEKRGDPRAAIKAYERLLAVDSDDASTLDALEALYTMVGDWRGLIGVLELKVKAAFSAEERGDGLRRVGSVLEELLGDRDAAIAAYKRAVEEVDTDERALEALDRLYAAVPKPQELSAVVARRIELAQVPADRIELGLRLGELYEDSLHQVDEAIETYRRVLDDDAEQKHALLRLAVLYERQGMWQELLENLRTQIGLATSVDERVVLHCRAGGVLERELADVPEAIESYRQALSIDPRCDSAIAALMALTAKEDYRALASDVVEPLLREQERWDDLVKLIERRVPSIMDPVERRMELVRLAEIHEHGRGSALDAFAALKRALADEPTDTAVQDELERLARPLDSGADLYAVFMERAAGISDPADAAALFRRAGGIAEEHLRDDARAIDAYVQASQRDDDAPETLLALDRLYVQTERWQELVDVLERRVAALTSPSERAELLIRLGQVRDVRFGDGHGAFVAFSEVLENDPGEALAIAGMQRLGQRDDLARDVLDVLERCFRETGAIDKVVSLYDIKIRLAPSDGEKIRLLSEAAAMWENELHEPRKALDCLRRAYEIDSRDLGLLDQVERVATAGSAWADLAGLAQHLAASRVLEGARKREVLLRVAGLYREHIGDPVGEELCLVGALALDPKQLTVHARLTELLREKAEPAALVSELRAYADVEPDAALRTERLREAGELALDAGDVATAAVCFEGVLASGGDEAGALSALAEIREAGGRAAESAELLLRWLAIETDPTRRIELRYRIAELQTGVLAAPARAVDTYAALLAEHPDETRAAGALEQLLESLERWSELEALLQGRLARVGDAAERVALRVKLAGLLEVRLGQPDGAIEMLRALVLDAPGYALALDELERLYAHTQRHEDLATLLGTRVADAATAGQPELAAAKAWSLVCLYENTLGDDARALRTLVQLQTLTPHDQRVLTELIRLYQKSEHFLQAAGALDQLITMQTGAEAASSALALADLAKKRLSDPALAENALRRALALDPSRMDAREALRSHLEQTEQHQKLAELLAEDAAAAATPAEQAALYTRVASLYSTKLNEPAAAVSFLERATQLVPDDRAALLLLCDLYIAAQRQVDAVPVLEKIIASYGGRRAKEVAVYEHRLGQAYESAGNSDEALKHYDAAFKIDLTSVPVLRDLGRICLARGDLDRAQKTYRALLLQKLGADVGINKADVYFRLGEISLKQNDKPKAKSMLERAISEAGQHPAAKAMLEQL